MSTVSNTTETVIGLPDGQIVHPGKSVEVDNSMENHKVVRVWLQKGVLKAGGAKTQEPSQSDDQDTRKVGRPKSNP